MLGTASVGYDVPDWGSTDRLRVTNTSIFGATANCLRVNGQPRQQNFKPLHNHPPPTPLLSTEIGQLFREQLCPLPQNAFSVARAPCHGGRPSEALPRYFGPPRRYRRLQDGQLLPVLPPDRYLACRYRAPGRLPRRVYSELRILSTLPA